jgi:hypothetical protein
MPDSKGAHDVPLEGNPRAFVDFHELADQSPLVGHGHNADRHKPLDTPPVQSRMAGYYNGTGTDLSLNKGAPISCAAETAGRILCRPILGGLHRQYVRI